MALFSSGKAILPLTLDVPPLAGSTSVIPAETAGTQADTDVSGRILRAWIPAIHAGITKPTVCLETESLFFHSFRASARLRHIVAHSLQTLAVLKSAKHGTE
jgi:hypothetical protein